MTTQVTVDVNGRYVATVIRVDADGKPSAPVEVHGRYEGSPNPTGKHTFHCYHPAVVSFEITETYLGDTVTEKPLTLNEAAHGHE